MKPDENKDSFQINKHSKQKHDNKSRSVEDAAADEKATIELSEKLCENKRFDFKTVRQYKVEVIADAVARLWEKLDDENKVLTSGLFVRATKYREDIGKNIDITSLRLMIADKILEFDQTNSIRIFASIITEPLKPNKPNELNPRLSKHLYTQFFQDNSQRYEKLFLKRNNRDALIILQHLVAAVTYSDSKDPALVAKQFQFITSMIDSGVVTLLDSPGIHSLVGAMRAWPISMISDVIKIYEQFNAMFPDKSNPFASLLAALEATPIKDKPQQPQSSHTNKTTKTADSVEPTPINDFTSQPITPPAPAAVQRNLEDPHEVILIVTECLKKLEGDSATKQQEIDRLNVEKRRNDQTRDKKRAQFESLQEENRQLKEEIGTLKTSISSKNSILQEVKNENDRLSAVLSSNEQKMAALVEKHEQAYNDLSNRLENISSSNINDFKRGLEIELSHEFNEINHLPTDEACIFHKDLIDTIFRKLRGKGINVGGGQ